jgi:uncharacterized membrane protein (DUF441 family)
MLASRLRTAMLNGQGIPTHTAQQPSAPGLLPPSVAAVSCVVGVPWGVLR